MIVIAGSAMSKDEPMVRELLAKGFEIKAAYWQPDPEGKTPGNPSGGSANFVLQKGTEAYVCQLMCSQFP
jgi:hypothetical protein